MSIRALTSVALVLLGTSLFTAPSAGAARRYYVSLGDSLSVGAQPAPGGGDEPTAHGYADYVFAKERRRIHGLVLVKLGCGGETTATFIHATFCRSHYPLGSQLATAESFLRTHHGRVALVTLDIGADDTRVCGIPSQAHASCLASERGAVAHNLAVIAGALRHAAGRGVRFVGMTYYDAYLAYYAQGASGPQAARETVAQVRLLNRRLTSTYRHAQFAVADVAKAFGTYGPLRPAADRICALTWMCGQPPRHDVHTKAAGAKLIARTIAAVVRHSASGAATRRGASTRRTLAALGA